jgi:hypothetical protein
VHAGDSQLFGDGAGLVSCSAHLANAIGRHSAAAIDAPLLRSLDTRLLTLADVLVRYRHQSGSLTRAAFLSARNDALANIAVIAAGLVTAFVWPSAWPDLIVGLGIAALNAGATRQVWTVAREEHRAVA